jgi:drug/metabolite transporter (DMT)-like permease
MVGRYVALAVACCWIASAPILIRVSEVDPATSLWLRMLIAAAVLAAAHDRNQPASSGRRGWLLAASLAFAIDILAYHLAVVRTSIANTAVLGQISPIAVAPLGYLLFGERQSLGSVLGLLGTFAGAVLLAGTGESGGYLGNGLAALSGVSYGAYLLILKGVAGNVSPRRMILWNCVVTALLVTPLALDQGAPALPHTMHGWLVILAMAFGCQLLGHGLVFYAIERLPASLTAQALLAPPVLSAGAALMLFGELPSLTQFAGAGLVLAGLFLAARHERRTSRALAVQAEASASGNENVAVVERTGEFLPAPAGKRGAT